jgi:hypothetical protein
MFFGETCVTCGNHYFYSNAGGVLNIPSTTSGANEWDDGVGVSFGFLW